jgi:uncharacterized protein YqeY
MLHEDIKNGIKEAMLAKDEVRLMTLRSISAALTNELVKKEKKPTEMLGDEEVLGVIVKLAKQRKDSINQYKLGGRDDLVKEEEAQLAVLQEFLPKMMERAEVETFVRAKAQELNIGDASQRGKLMSVLMGELKGKAEGAVVKEIVDSLF